MGGGLKLQYFQFLFQVDVIPFLLFSPLPLQRNTPLFLIVHLKFSV